MKTGKNVTVNRSHAKSKSRLLFIGLFGIAFALMSLTDAQAQGFEAEIRAFEQADIASPPPADPVLFVGSSSIRVWPDLPGDFPDYPVMNRGFGGSHMSDVLYYFDRIVAAYDPALILVYEGDNDLAGGKSVDTVYADYVVFLALVEEKLPGADVAFIATKPSPSRSQYLEVTRQLNTRLEELADSDPHIWFVDVFDPMLGDDGQPRRELFGNDMLHMNAAGYVLWQSIIEPMLDEWASGGVRVFLFDFGASDTITAHGPPPDDPVNFWNNVTPDIGGSATGQLLGIVDTENTPTEIGLQMISPFNAGQPNRGGTLTAAVFPVNATRDALYSYEDADLSLEMFASFKLTGLAVKRPYNFTFYASCTGITDRPGGKPASLEADYTVIGANSATVAYDPANNNYDRIAAVAGIIPDAAGEITISLTPTERHSRFSIHLGAMKMEEMPEQEPIVFLEEPADRTVLAYRSATFEAKVDSTPPYTVQWLRDGEPIPDANDFAYTIDVVTPDLDGAAFSVNVSNLLYSATSREAMLTVVPDVNARVLLSAASTNGYTIELAFDERLDSDTVMPVDNYVVNEGAVAVVSAELDADSKTIVLMLGERLAGAFNVSVSAVRDMTGNEIRADSTTSGQVLPEVLLFDFGSGSTPTEDDPENIWNNITESVGASNSGKLLDLLTVDGRTTEIDLVMINRFNGANENGTLQSVLFPADATRDSLYGNTEAFNNLTDVFPSFKLTELDPLLTYDFTFYASRMGVRDNRETVYTVTGAGRASAALNAGANIDQFATVTGIEPDAAGEITISIAPTANNDNANHFTYLGVMKVEPTPDN
ncbi:MAG: GDSL-type esterase/lipase family protein [Planctomycetota bacterium]